MSATLERCEGTANARETKHCATSIESMVDFAVSALATNYVSAVLTVANATAAAEIAVCVRCVPLPCGGGGDDEGVRDELEEERREPSGGDRSLSPGHDIVESTARDALDAEKLQLYQYQSSIPVKMYRKEMQSDLQFKARFHCLPPLLKPKQTRRKDHKT
ncbi:hypothetical protein ZIOFF_017566 [Zingiber officinale]|uniref:BURP domain-containing protein n=1 Tax=Zingiber officinale TaxID=94328 RepID=A0A8J5HBV8_ZINOF|nr:hypothetical protein ZIOFF_017566 [Zingiber officinale]